MSKLYTPQEAAKAWRVHINTVYLWIRQGRVEAIPVGRNYRIPEEQMQKGSPANVNRLTQVESD